MCSYFADAVKTLALTELLFDLSGALFGLFQAAHSIGVLTVTEVDVAQVEVSTIEILQQLALSLHKGKQNVCYSKHKVLNKVQLMHFPVLNVHIYMHLSL